VRASGSRPVPRRCDRQAQLAAKKYTLRFRLTQIRLGVNQFNESCIDWPEPAFREPFREGRPGGLTGTSKNLPEKNCEPFLWSIQVNTRPCQQRTQFQSTEPTRCGRGDLSLNFCAGGRPTRTGLRFRRTLFTSDLRPVKSVKRFFTPQAQTTAAIVQRAAMPSSEKRIGGDSSVSLSVTYRRFYARSCRAEALQKGVNQHAGLGR
jgi:hypothetical protein